MLVSRFHIWHGTLLVKKTDCLTLELFFLLRISVLPEKTIRSIPFVS
ncbi:hypothetical protein HMPREF9347_02709 [Escherichia coli MS 124-1]|nr:hypothetical protein HMPREF9347_02709 [Escherichia coli MS 124-1]